MLGSGHTYRIYMTSSVRSIFWPIYTSDKKATPFVFLCSGYLHPQIYLDLLKIPLTHFSVLWHWHTLVLILNGTNIKHNACDFLPGTLKNKNLVRRHLAIAWSSSLCRKLNVVINFYICRNWNFKGETCWGKLTYDCWTLHRQGVQ